MILRVKDNLSINNLRNHSPEIVDELRAMLTGGVSARLDPRRRNFYELDAGSRVFYIHWTPEKARVMFLAVWSKERRQENVRSEDHIPALCCSPCE
jgi:hypothetical protein